MAVLCLDSLPAWINSFNNLSICSSVNESDHFSNGEEDKLDADVEKEVVQHLDREVRSDAKGRLTAWIICLEGVLVVGVEGSSMPVCVVVELKVRSGSIPGLKVPQVLC